MKNIKKPTKSEHHPDFIWIFHSQIGWHPILMYWDLDPYSGELYHMEIGTGHYGHSKENYDKAVAEAKAWSKRENIQLKTPPPFKHFKQKTHKSISECLQEIYNDQTLAIRCQPHGPEPIPVIGEMEIILKQRTGPCQGCKWHPNVCDHCMRDLEEDHKPISDLS